MNEFLESFNSMEEYICPAPSCSFSSRVDISFRDHLAVGHSNKVGFFVYILFFLFVSNVFILIFKRCSNVLCAIFHVLLVLRMFFYILKKTILMKMIKLLPELMLKELKCEN